MVSMKNTTKSPSAMLGLGMLLGILIMTMLTATGLLSDPPHEVANIEYVPVPISAKHIKNVPLNLLSNPSGVFKPQTLLGGKGYAIGGPPGQPQLTVPRVIGLPKPDNLKVFGEEERRQWLNKAARDVLDVVKEEAVKAVQKEVKDVVRTQMSTKQHQQGGDDPVADEPHHSLGKVVGGGLDVDGSVIPENLPLPSRTTRSGDAETTTKSKVGGGGGGYNGTSAFLSSVPVDFTLSDASLKVEDKQEKQMSAPDFPVDIHPEEPLFNDPVATKYSYRRGGLHPREGDKKPTLHGIPWDKKLVPEGWEAQSVVLAQAALDGNWIEEEEQWNGFFKHNARGMLSWGHYAMQRTEAARLQKLKKEIVTFKDVILGMKAAFEMAATLRESGKEDEIIPVYGYAFTRYDFIIMLHGLARYIDTGVDSFVFVQNGANPVAEVYLRSLQHIFGSEKVAVYRRQHNMGVSNSWNAMSTHGFDMVGKEQAFVLISNADCIAAPGRLATFAKATWLGLVQGENDNQRMIINRLGEFALFIITHVGWRKMGLFDENLFPAYGEDVEIHIRAVSLGLGGDLTFRNTGSQKESKDFYHLHATNSKKGIGYSRPAMMQYISKKWGVNMAGVRDFQFARPYRHPWNNCRVFHNDSWIIDWGYRDCLRTRAGCLYPVQSATKLIHSPLRRGAECTEGFIMKKNK